MCTILHSAWVAHVLGIYGACGREELANMAVSDLTNPIRRRQHIKTMCLPLSMIRLSLP